MMMRFEGGMENLLRVLAAKTGKPMATIIAESLAIYDAVLTMEGEPAILKDGQTYPIDVRHEQPTSEVN